MTTQPPTREQVNNSPYRPLVRRTSAAPAPQTQQAYRESVGTTAATHREDVPYTTNEQKPRRTGYGGQAIKLERRRQQPVSPDVADEKDEGEDEYDDPGSYRMPSSARRYQVQPYGTRGAHETHYQVHHHEAVRLPRRRAGQLNRATPPDVIYTGAAGGQPAQAPPPQPAQAPPPQPTSGIFRQHPLLWIGLGMIAMLGLWVGLSAALSWWNVHQDDMIYGRPRTAQYDVVVGHHDGPGNPTHFIAMNLHDTVVVIEVPGGDTSKGKMYTGPQIYGTNADLDPVTLTFRDVKHDGKLAMLVHVEGETIIYLNENGQFVQQPAH